MRLVHTKNKQNGGSIHKTALVACLCAAGAASATTLSTIPPYFAADSLHRRWEGWATSTTITTIYVTGPEQGTTTIGIPGNPNPATTTLTVTFQTQVPTGVYTQTVTQYPPTFTPPPASIVTITTTLYPSGVSPPKSSQTKTISSGGDKRPGPFNATCLPGDAAYAEPGRNTLKATRIQAVTLYVIAIFLATDFIAWHLVIVRQIIYPVKLCVTAWHELGHVIGIVLSGRRLVQCCIDANEGGLSQPEGGILAFPLGALPWGYLFSITIGGALTFCGFNTLASKVASFFIGISLAAVFWIATLYAKMLCTGAVALLIGLWFIDHTVALRYYVLYFGVMSSWYIVWDVTDDLIFRKPNLCCPALHQQSIPRVSAATWTIVYFLLSAVGFTLWILLAIAVWRQDAHSMYCQSQGWLAT